MRWEYIYRILYREKLVDRFEKDEENVPSINIHIASIIYRDIDRNLI